MIKKTLIPILLILFFATSVSAGSTNAVSITKMSGDVALITAREYGATVVIMVDISTKKIEVVDSVIIWTDVQGRNVINTRIPTNVNVKRLKKKVK